MLYEVLRHIRNFFPLTGKKLRGTFEIEDGMLVLPLLKDQFFLIEGSVLNDGVYRYPCTFLRDEVFEGVITPLAIPESLLQLVGEIIEFNQKSQSTSNIYTSESFGGYSYTKPTNSKGAVISWKDAYRDRLDVWRKK